MQLFCFTFAGGTAAFFDKLEDELKSQIKVIKLEYAGHGKRHKEVFYHSFSELADDMYEQIKSKYESGSYALFGYSMGSLSVIEVLKQIIQRQEMKLPERIFLAAHEPFTKDELLGFKGKELDTYVKERTIRFRGIPEKLLENRSFWRIYLPIYRADYSLIANYKFEELELKTEIPTQIFYSETDTALRNMLLWKKYFVGECEFIQYSGSHFFIQQHYKEIAELILRKMKVD